LHNDTIEKFNIYTQKYCLLGCLNDYIQLTCKNGIPQFTNLSKLEFTLDNILSNSVCISNSSSFFYNNKSLNEECYIKCPKECDKIEYNLVTSLADYPTIFHANLMKAFFENYKDIYPSHFYNFTDLSEFKKDVLAINIYFQDISYTNIEQSLVIDTLDLISSVGGLLGLWIGASVLSLVEIIELIFKLIKIKFLKNKITRITDFNTN
jgi:hypothetical protein